MSAIIHPFSRQVSPNLRAGLPDPSKYTVCRKRLSLGWLVDLRFELGLTHTSVKEPVAIRSGWGLPLSTREGEAGRFLVPLKGSYGSFLPRL
jgi:hypothetical protein